MRTIVWSLPPITPHGRWQRQLDAYLDGELSASAERRFARHLSGCERCAAALSEARAVKTLFATLPQESAPRSFALSEAMLAPVPTPRPRAALPSPPTARSAGPRASRPRPWSSPSRRWSSSTWGVAGARRWLPRRASSRPRRAISTKRARPPPPGAAQTTIRTSRLRTTTPVRTAWTRHRGSPLGESDGGSRRGATPDDAEPEALSSQASPDITNAAAGEAPPR